MSEYHDIIKNELKKIKIKSANHNGLTHVQLHNITGIEIKKIKGILNEMYIKKEINIIITAHGKAVRLN